MSTLEMIRSELGELIGKYLGRVDGRDFRQMVAGLADELFGFDDPTDAEIEALQKAFSICCNDNATEMATACDTKPVQ